MQALSKDIIVTISMTLFLLLMTSFIVAFVVYHRRRQEQFVVEKLRLQQQFKEELLRAQLEIQEQTLKNISQEIHDNIGQTLSLVKLNLNTIESQKPNNQDKIISSRELISKAIQDLRNLSKSLNTDSILSTGLVKAIETELSVINYIGDFKTQFEANRPTVRIDSKKELILFRIVQEAINNIIKHSDATMIKVKLYSKDEQLQIEVCDNGKGFQPHVGNGEGIGLGNMKNRAELIGGNFNIQSNPNGTIITVILPITES